jgi:hypothetical protein
MRRVGLVVLILSSVLLTHPPAHAQTPGTLLDPSQVDPGITQAVAGEAAAIGYAYVGDCAVAAPNDGELCSEVFEAGDGTVTAWLVDDANNLVEQLVFAPTTPTTPTTAPAPAPTTSPRPAPAPQTAPASSSAPAGATAQCKDGTYSYSQHRSGTCSGHGGVAVWINPPPS